MNGAVKRSTGVQVEMTGEPEVAIVGMGYVGLTLAVKLADLGFKVWGYERDPQVVRQLKDGRPQIFEPGVEQILKSRQGRNLTIESRLPTGFAGVIIICVSTPVGTNRRPHLDNLRAAAESVAESAADGALVIVRSTVPVGTCRKLVLPVLMARRREVYLACCPERTIQGQALGELGELPQLVGGLNEASTRMAIQFWSRVTRLVIPLSSLEAAEAVKLINNCHTDLIYSYGNEVAMMAHRLGLDPSELIRAANLDYPRPDLARPGFVAGPCMSKDPYILLHSLEGDGYLPKLVAGAREINESLPEKVALHFIENLEKFAGGINGAKVLVCGFAYKGWPVTDDIRGTPTIPIVSVLRRYSVQLYGHDYLVAEDAISACGVCAVEDLGQGFHGARGVLFVNEHPEYRGLDIKELARTMESPAVVYDCWRLFDAKSVESVPGIHYAGIGYG